MGNCYSENDYKTIKQSRAYYDAKSITILILHFDQKLLDYTGPKLYGPLNIDVKRCIVEKTKNAKNIVKIGLYCI